VGKMQTQTHVRAAAKGHPGILVTCADSIIRKAPRIELERLRPDFRHAVREEEIGTNARASWDVVTFELEVAHGGAWYSGHRGIGAQGSLEGNREEGELPQPFVRKTCPGRKP